METSRAVIFDLDGTLVDSRRAVVDAVLRGVRECLTAHGETAHVDAAAARAALGLPALDYFRALLPQRLHHLAADALARSTEREVEALRAGEGRLFPGVLEGLLRLRNAGWGLAVVSNAQLPYFEAALQELGIGPHCDFTRCHDQLEAAEDPRPPKERLLGDALTALGADPTRSWMVGDRAEDLHAGQRQGCHLAGASYGFGEGDELALAELRFDRFEQLVTALESVR